MILIENPADPKIADYCHVKDAHLAKQRGIFLAEGMEVVRTLVTKSAFETKSVFLSHKRVEQMQDVLHVLPEGTPVYVASPEVLSEVVGFNMHRGCLAAGHRPDERGLQNFASEIQAQSLVVVLEGLANNDNVGGVFRNAACFGADAILLDPTCADPLYRKSIRTSMGATLRVPFFRMSNLAEGLDALKANGFTRYGLSPRSDAHALDDFLSGVKSLPARRAFILGSEGPGLSSAAFDVCDAWVRIPMAPTVDSLNVATASGIAMWAMRVR